MTVRRWGFPLAAVLVVATLVFVWPTVYRYDSRQVQYGSNKETTVYRTNRLTGSVDKLSDDGWVTCRPSDATVAEDGIPMTPEDVGKLSGDLNIKDGWIDGKVYNGSSFRVVEVSMFVVELIQMKEAPTEEQQAERFVLPTGKEVKTYSEVNGKFFRVRAERTFTEHTSIEPHAVRRVLVDTGLPANTTERKAFAAIYAGKKAKGN